MAEWFVQVDGKQYGPFDSAKLVKLAAAGKLTPTDRVRKGRDGQWKLASSVRRLFDPETQANYSASKSITSKKSDTSKRRSSSAPSEPAGEVSRPKQRRPAPKAPAPVPEPMFDLAEEIVAENPYAAPKAAPVAEAPARRKSAPEPTLMWMLFSFQGRIPRRHYWGTNIATGILFNIAVTALTAMSGEGSSAAVIGVLVLYVVLVWISFAVQAKRWHDRDKSAWWLLINLAPCVGALWIFVELGCLRGTDGGNQYGPDPT